MHRDLKPENVLLNRDLMPKIADFGLARTVGSSEVCRTIAGTPGYIAPEVLDVRVPYDFPADVYSLGLVFADMLNQTSCCQWWLADKPEPVKERFLKKWPADKSPATMSDAILKLPKRLTLHVPGERTTAYQLCQDLMELADKDPMPCKLLSVTPKMPSGPPAPRVISPVDAADIAGRLGYTKGSNVMVRVADVWKEGEVDHISTALCPGAAQVRFQGEECEQLILIAPGQFAEFLRPAMQVPLSVERSVITMHGDIAAKGTVERRNRKSRTARTPRPVPEAAKSKCQPAGCCVQ